MNIIDESHIIRDFVSLEAEASLDKLLELFKTEHDVYVFQNENYLGCVTEHDLMGYEGEVDTTSSISRFVNLQPVVTLKTPFYEAARIMLHNRTHSVGVKDKDGTFLGIIPDSTIISSLGEAKDMPLMDYMSSNLVTISEKASVTQAIDLLRGNKISRLPVIDDNYDIVGLISAHDILELFLETSISEKKREKALVSDLMDKNPILTSENQTLSDAANLMIEKKTYAVTILREGTKIPLGIITITDLLENMSIDTPKEGYRVKVIGDYPDDTLEYLVEEALAVVSKFAYFIGSSGQIIIRTRHYPKRKFRGLSLYNVRLRVIGNKGYSLTAKADSYGIEGALQIALDHLESATINMIDISEDRRRTIFDARLDDL